MGLTELFEYTCTELHNNQKIPQFEGKRWICSELTQEVNVKSADPTTDVTILVSARMI